MLRELVACGVVWLVGACGKSEGMRSEAPPGGQAGASRVAGGSGGVGGSSESAAGAGATAAGGTAAGGTAAGGTAAGAGGSAGAGGVGGAGKGGTTAGLAGGDYGGALNRAQVGAVLAPPECEKIMACCNSADLHRMFLTWSMYPTSVAECTDMIDDVISSGVFDLEQARDRGSLHYTPELVAACARTITLASCDDWDPQRDALHSVDSPECAGVIKPLVADGGHCQSWNECISGGCDYTGTCENLGKLGEACGNAPPYTCAYGLHCPNGTCVKTLPVGSSCYLGQECSSGACIDRSCAAYCAVK